MAQPWAKDVRQVLARRQHHIANRAGTPLEAREKACAAERVQSRKFERLLRQWLLLRPPERPPVERLIDEAPPEATAVAGAVKLAKLEFQKTKTNKLGYKRRIEKHEYRVRVRS